LPLLLPRTVVDTIHDAEIQVSGATVAATEDIDRLRSHDALSDRTTLRGHLFSGDEEDHSASNHDGVVAEAFVETTEQCDVDGGRMLPVQPGWHHAMPALPVSMCSGYIAGVPSGWSSSPARRSAPSGTSRIRSGTRCASCRRPRVEDRRRFGFPDPPWDLIGIYTQGRLLSPPAAADRTVPSGVAVPGCVRAEHWTAHERLYRHRADEAVTMPTIDHIRVCKIDDTVVGRFSDRQHSGGGRWSTGSRD
jgi:hypothetical protein